MSVILSLKNISRSFPGVQALDNVSFKVSRGTIHAVIGANGAGKSTLMKILSGALAPDSGTIEFIGKTYHPSNPNEAIRSGVATIYQELNILPTLSVIANITVGKEPHNFGFLNFEEAKEKVNKVLTQLNATNIPLDKVVGNLKVSEKQIIEIAKALISECKLLIMDEPTASLNKNEIEALFKIMKGLKHNGVTILYVSHRLGEIFQLANYVTVLRDGKHIQTSSIAQVTPESLITSMMGQKIEGVYPKKNSLIGEEKLKVEDLGSKNSFRHINFSLLQGEVIAITGLAGSGKVELGKALIGDWPIETGKIFLNGKQITPNPTKAKARQIGYMPEDRKKEGVLEGLSVKRNISLPSLPDLSRALGFINFVRERDIAQLEVNKLEIKTPSIDQLVRNLSGGNQQKVALAKWLATGSKVLILIEPTQGIDVGVKFEIYKLVSELSSSGALVIIISSEISEILGLAHRIIVMYNGNHQATLVSNKTNEEEILQYIFGQKGAIK